VVNVRGISTSKRGGQALIGLRPVCTMVDPCFSNVHPHWVEDNSYCDQHGFPVLKYIHYGFLRMGHLAEIHKISQLHPTKPRAGIMEIVLRGTASCKISLKWRGY